MKFNYSIEELKGDIFMLKIDGDLQGELTSSEFMDDITDKVESGKIKAIIDLKRMNFISSSGIGILITILTKLRNKGGELVLMNPSEKLNKLLAMTKLLAIFNIVDNKNKALEILNQK